MQTNNFSLAFNRNLIFIFGTTFLLFSLFFSHTAQAAGATGPWITGFYSAQNGVESIANIPWSKYSHVNYFAAAPGVNGTVAAGYTTPSEMTALVASRPSGKKAILVISDGASGTSGATSFTGAIGSNSNTFVTSIVSFVNQYGFDGVDLDWEANVNVSQFENLLSLLRTAMPSKVISIDVGNWGGLETVAATSQSNLDQINVMCYDMDTYGPDGTNSSISWHNDALLQNGHFFETCDWRIAPFISAGVAKAKLGIGIPYYGRIWSGATQPQQSGASIQSTTYYRNIVASYGDPAVSPYHHLDTTFTAEYLGDTSANKFISFNGVWAIQQAVNWGKAQGYGGYMVFTLEYEYLASQSGDARYPLSTALYAAVSGSGSVDTTPPSVPTALSGVPASSSQINLSWTASTDNVAIAGYKVFRNGTQIGTSVSPIYSDTGLAPSTTYTYTVSAYDGAGNSSAQSTTVSLTTLAQTPNPVTDSLGANPTSVTGGQSATLTWSSTNATSCTGTNFTPGGTSGSLYITPTVTTTYTLTCSNNSSSQSASATVTVNPVINPTFALGSRVKTTVKLNVRSKASSSKHANILCVQPTGALGTIIGGPTSSNGSTWWNVNFDSSCDGWVVQTYLSLVPVAEAPIIHTLTIGSKGQEVTTLQYILSKLGIYHDDITGYFGTATKAAVTELQSSNNLASVGIVGPLTRALIGHLIGGMGW